MISEGLDWFAFTLRKNQMEVLDHVYAFLRSKGVQEDFVGGGRWYRERRVFKNGVCIQTRPTSKNSLPVLVELPGEFFNEHGEDGEKLCVEVAPFANVNRIDWRVDFFSKPGELERVCWPEEFMGLRKQRIEPQKSENVDGCGYTGIKSGVDEFVLRYYDKKEESGGAMPKDEFTEWWRLEWVVRKVLCKSQTWYSVVDVGDIRARMVHLLVARFKVPFNLVGGCDALPRIRYSRGLKGRYEEAKKRAERSAIRLAEIEEEIGDGGLLEF